MAPRARMPPLEMRRPRDRHHRGAHPWITLISLWAAAALCYSAFPSPSPAVQARFRLQTRTTVYAGDIIAAPHPLLNDREMNAVLASCPCVSETLCLPVTLQESRFGNQSARREVFAFSVATDDRWKHYDWDTVTTVAWNEDKDLLCHAHSKGVKVVVKHNFDEPEQLCNTTARREWIESVYQQIVTNFADGVNIDTEKPMFGEISHCQTTLIHELRAELELHTLTKDAQITFDVPWAPRGIDGRYYHWRELADAVDFVFVMSYDMRSQIYFQCVAGANSPLALVRQGLLEFIRGYGVTPDKLVLGVPWYGYKYKCQSFTEPNAICVIKPESFFDAPCSDAAGSQIEYGTIQRLLQDERLGNENITRHWDEMTQSPFLVMRSSSNVSSESSVTQLWYDDAASLQAKYALVSSLGLRGVGMWNADTLDYDQNPVDAQRMWKALTTAFQD